MYSRKLEIFIAVAQEGSFSQAAQRLYISPTAVKKQIDRLEDLLGLDLFQRSSRGVKLTEAGHSFYQDSLALIDQSQKAIHRAKQIAQKSPYLIRLGRSFLNPAQDFFPLWHRFNQHYPQFKLEVVPFEDNQQSILETIKHLGQGFDLMVGACDSLKWLEYVQLLPLKEAKLTCAMAKNHPLKGKACIQLEDLNDQDLIMVKEGHSQSNDALRSYLKSHYRSIHIIDAAYYYDLSTFNRCEQTGAILLSLDVWEDIHPSLITIPLAWSGPGVPYGIIYSKEPNDQVAKFIKVLANLH